MRQRRGSQFLLLLGLWGASACTTAHPNAIDLSPKPALDQRDVLEFRYRGESITLESVRYTTDSVTGIPWHAATDPRVAYLLKDVTNAKVYGTGKSADQASRSIVIGMVVALFGFMALLAHGLAD